MRLKPGRHELSSARDVLSAELIEEVVFGDDRLRAEPFSAGEYRLVRVADGDSGIIYRFVFSQRLVLPDGRDFAIELSGLNFSTRDGVPVVSSRELDEDFLSSQMRMEGSLDGEPVVAYSSCSYSSFPEWTVEVETDEGTSVRLSERFQPSENDLGTGRAALVRAELSIGGDTLVVTDYWQLVYSARRHNRDVRYWVVLEPTVKLPALAAPVRVVEIEVGQLPRSQFVRYLDEDFEVLLEPEVAFYEKQLSENRGPRFVRGDVTADGRLNVIDSVTLNAYLFAGRSVLPCLKSADTDDSGRIDLADAILILNHLFGLGAAPAPPYPGCGTDGVEDNLSCDRFPMCP